MSNKLRYNGDLMNFETPKIMGILNLTPDSFYDGNDKISQTSIEQKITKYIDEGVNIIDIGAVSTRPGAKIVPAEEEWRRLLPALQIIKNFQRSIPFSLDTFRSNIAKKAITDYGVSIINDISAGTMDKKMFETIADLKVPYIIMHMQGTPETMQINPSYSNLTKEICLFFSEKIETLKLMGVHDIIIDPGFGFGKTVEQNFYLLKNLNTFKIFNLPIAVGISRKSMIYKTLDTLPDLALSGTIAAQTIALQNGANIVRVHDVSEAIISLKIVQQLNTQLPNN